MMKHSAALPLTWFVLRLFIVVNWLYGAALLALLFFSVTNEQWTFTAFGVPPSPETRWIVMGMRAIAALGLAAVPLNYAFLKRLLAMVETVRRGDPFIAVNAARLQTIAWVLLGLQLLSLAIGGIGKAISTPAHPLHLDAGFSLSGWLAVLLSFVVARVFDHGTQLRDDLEGTV